MDIEYRKTDIVRPVSPMLFLQKVYKLSKNTQNNDYVPKFLCVKYM